MASGLLEHIMDDLAVVVVTYNSEEVIGVCLDALEGLPVLVIDNASSDRTVCAVRGRAVAGQRLRILENVENVGFAAAVNQGFQGTNAGAVLILNPDVKLLTPLKPLLEACQRSGIAAGMLVGASSGEPQRGFTIRRFPTPWTLVFEVFGLNRIWPGNPVNRRYRYLDRNCELPGMVEQPAGAFLAVRRDVWASTGGFDEGFWPAWFEDVDFLKRANDLGFPAEYCPEVRAEHIGGHSVNKLPETLRKRNWYSNLLRYATKHYREIPYRAVCGAVALASLPRMVAGMIAERSVGPFASYGAVVRLATRRAFARTGTWEARTPGATDHQRGRGIDSGRAERGR
ncbi:MAG: glycosyltransferase family 2 protein [Bryobacteraceae bacterium]|nr:glycosyltransferase family 2 protein [Bryobacteraceae bacterium]